MPELITEAGGSGGMKATKGAGRFLATLITPGWGSSGYYSAEALQQAVADKVWPKSTQQHIDHQTAEERAKKPEGSINTLAAVLMEDARWDAKGGPDGKGAVVAETKVFSKWREPIAEMAEHIGVSIVAPADMSVGEAEGKAGRIVERLYPAVTNRVDFVTHAGRGGSIEAIEALQVQEARNIGQWLEARMHQSFTGISDEMYGDGRLTREERISLSSALGNALAAFTATVDEQAPTLWTRDLWEMPDEPSAAESITNLLVASGIETAAATEAVNRLLNADGTPKNVTATPGQTRQEDHPQEGNNMAEIMIESSRLEQLEESHGRVQTLVQERDAANQRAAESDRRAAVAESTVRAREFAATLVREANAELSDAAVGRVVAEATREIPLTEDLRLDTDILTEATNAARVAEESYLARIAQESGLGTVRGVGATEAENKPAITKSDAREAILALTRRK